jgi:hypothetical protein
MSGLFASQGEHLSADGARFRNPEKAARRIENIVVHADGSLALQGDAGAPRACAAPSGNDKTPRADVLLPALETGRIMPRIAPAQYRAGRSRRIGASACTQGTVPSSGRRHAPGETGSVRVRRPPSGTAERTCGAGRVEPASRCPHVPPQPGRHPTAPLATRRYPRSDRPC